MDDGLPEVDPDLADSIRKALRHLRRASGMQPEQNVDLPVDDAIDVFEHIVEAIGALEGWVPEEPPSEDG